jgi:hypothetical protein
MTPTKILAVGLVVALCATWYSNHLLNIERTAHADTRATYAEQVAEAERAAREQSEKNRATEQELRDAQETHAAEVKALHLNLDRARNRSAMESRRMQDAANAVAARARAQCADSPASDMGTPAGDPIGVLGRVLGEIDDHAGVVAEFADRSRVAGLACEAAYDRAREALMK